MLIIGGQNFFSPLPRAFAFVELFHTFDQMLAADSCPDPCPDPNPDPLTEIENIPNNSSIETENSLKKSSEKPKNKRVKLNKTEKPVKEKVPKEKKPEKLDSNQSQEIILNYLNSQNRPYNAVDVFNNLKGVLSKPIVVKTLAELVSKGIVTS
jgi:TBPIP/Hop2 winged helix domain